MKGEEINYSNDLNCCIDVRDANLGDKIDENINIVASESKNEDNNNNNKTKKKRKCVQLMLEYLHMLAKENIL